MWILIIIAGVVILIIIASNNAEKKIIKNKVALQGGMLNLFRILIDGLLNEEGNPEIIQITDDSISVGIVNLNDSAIFQINQHHDKVLIVWTLKKSSLGDHVLRWEFPDGLDQNEMLRTIKSHVINYLQKLPNPQANIKNEWSDLTINQKMSVLNLLFVISIGDNGSNDSNKRISILNSYIELLGVSRDRCQTYFETEGYETMIKDLNQLSQTHKEFLIVAAYDMITRSGKTKDNEIILTGDIFERIGIDGEKFFATIEKSRLLKNYFHN